MVWGHRISRTGFVTLGLAATTCGGLVVGEQLAAPALTAPASSATTSTSPAAGPVSANAPRKVARTQSGSSRLAPGPALGTPVDTAAPQPTAPQPVATGMTPLGSPVPPALPVPTVSTSPVIREQPLNASGPTASVADRVSTGIVIRPKSIAAATDSNTSSGSLRFELPPKPAEVSAGPAVVPPPADPVAPVVPVVPGSPAAPTAVPLPPPLEPELSESTLDTLSPPPVAAPVPQVAPETIVDSPEVVTGPNGQDSGELAPYWHRTHQTTADDVTPCVTIDAPLPPGFTPWWQDLMVQSVRVRSNPFSVNVDALTLAALQHSPYVIAVTTDPQIRQTLICEEVAEFDWRAFVESKYDDLSDPVGNLLTTGGSPRFRDNHWTGNTGVRRKNQIGGEFRAQQRVGFQDNNSQFFVPKQQGTTRLELNYTQPLLKGAGRCYNQSRIILASIDTEVAGRESARLLQEHLLKVTQTYWELYRARSVFLQKQKLLDSAAAVEELLEARREVDVLERQVLRARAATAARRSAMARAETEIRNAESRLRLLVNSPRMIEASQLELLPADMPPTMHIDVSVTGSLQTALVNRPDIGEAIQRVKATGVRLGVARQDLLPKLDLILNTYVAGLQGDGNVGQAWADQFSVGEPGYTVGMLFEVPLGNRAAGAQYTRRELEMRKALAEFKNTIETGLTEVELAMREAETSYQEMLSKYQSMLAAERESLYLLERWKVLPDADRSSVLLLEDLLDSQERLANEEAAFVGAQVAYVLSLAELKRVMGVLMASQIVTPVAFMEAAQSHTEGLPTGETVDPNAPYESITPGAEPGTSPPGERQPIEPVAPDGLLLPEPVEKAPAEVSSRQGAFDTVSSGRRSPTVDAGTSGNTTPRARTAGAIQRTAARTSEPNPKSTGNLERNPYSSKRLPRDVPEAAPGRKGPTPQRD
jgi:outer membrane protein TolC